MNNAGPQEYLPMARPCSAKAISEPRFSARRPHFFSLGVLYSDRESGREWPQDSRERLSISR
jgi:hypothetical protein